MKLKLDQTIVALASGTAGGRRAVVRFSGVQTQQILSKLLSGQAANDLLCSARVTSREAQIVLAGSIGDVPCRAYYWPDSRSYTGESAAELHLMGCMPIVESTIQRACELGARIAEPGEFTLRSFLAGKLDLTQAEAVLGVIEASNQHQLETALAQLGGNLTRVVRSLRQRLLELIADLEAGLDFVEEDITFISLEQLLAQICNIRQTLDELHHRLTTRTRSDRLPRCVLVGWPNTGKSSLLNAIVGSQRTIVSSLAGTTRDTIVQRVHVNDIEIDLCDTAGIEPVTDESPRSLAQAVLTQTLANSDVWLICIEATQFDGDPATALQPFHRLREQHAPSALPIVVCTQSDRLPADRLRGLQQAAVEGKWRICFTNGEFARTELVITSATTGVGIQQLKTVIRTVISGNCATDSTAFLHQTSARCGQCVLIAAEALSAAEDAARTCAGEEIVASELRLALDELGAIIGEVHTEDILGEIFSRFCIGK